MRTDTEKFKNAVAVAIRKSRKKWNPNRKTYMDSGELCGFCVETHKLDPEWLACEGGCKKLFFGGKSCLPKSINDCVKVHTGNKKIWGRACMLMNKRFDKIAKLYGVDA
jgi:hypothetical protein